MTEDQCIIYTCCKLFTVTKRSVPKVKLCSVIAWLAGLASNLHALRHFVRWKHPKVFAKEHVDSYPPVIFQVTLCMSK